MTETQACVKLNRRLACQVFGCKSFIVSCRMHKQLAQSRYLAARFLKCSHTCDEIRLLNKIKQLTTTAKHGTILYFALSQCKKLHAH